MFSSDLRKTCLGDYAKEMVKANFVFERLQSHFDDIKRYAENFDYEKLAIDKDDPPKASAWRYIARRDTGPYMITQSVHTQR